MTRRIKWMIWAIVVLFLMNVATLGTILYHNYKRETTIDSTVSAASFKGNALNGRFFRQTLGFNDDQMSVFRSANELFRPQTVAITLMIDSLKAEMFKEMQKEKPDTVRLNTISNEIGDRHSELKRHTYQFFLKVRATCSEEQASQLEKVFEPLFVEEKPVIRGQGYQRGWKRANN